ncbi:hypothetical protein [Deinococcus peraridilitoris]|nr:hypothetical protein [Deinococcus peraridilitoris]
MNTLIQELSEAARQVLDTDKLRTEHGAEPIWNRMQDQAMQRLQKARDEFEAWNAAYPHTDD